MSVVTLTNYGMMPRGMVVTIAAQVGLTNGEFEMIALNVRGRPAIREMGANIVGLRVSGFILDKSDLTELQALIYKDSHKAASYIGKLALAFMPNSEIPLTD